MVKVSHIIVSISIHAAVIAAALLLWGRVEEALTARRHEGVEYFDLIEVPQQVVATAPVVEPATAPVVEPAIAPVVESAIAPVVESAIAPVVESAIAPVVEHDGVSTFQLTAADLDISIRYPRMARREGREGEVLVEAVVGEDGTLGEVRVIRSSGSADLDAAAVEGVEKVRSNHLKEKCAAGAGRQVVKVPVVFRLTRKDAGF